MKVTAEKGGHPITWESLLAVIGASVLIFLIGGGVVFWLNYFLLGA